MTRRKFAFIVHPRQEIGADLGMRWPALRLVPEPLCEFALGTLRLPPITWGEVLWREEPLGWVILVPLSGRQMLQMRRERVLARVEAALDQARTLGAEIVGLGALTAPVTGGGQRLTHRKDLAVTNGNAYTAAVTYEAVQGLLAERPEAEVAVVGATGSVGSCLVRLLARRRLATRLTLVARDQGRLDALAAASSGAAPWLKVRASTEMAAVREADLVVLLTSSADCLLRSEHLKVGAVVLDDTQPRNTAPDLPRQRPDVRVLDGGLVAMPGLRLTGNLGLPAGCVFACLAETVLLALAGQRCHFSIGAPTPEQVTHISRLATRYGAALAPFHSFGRPLPASGGFARGCRQ